MLFFATWVTVLLSANSKDFGTISEVFPYFYAFHITPLLNTHRSTHMYKIRNMFRCQFKEVVNVDRL